VTEPPEDQPKESWSKSKEERAAGKQWNRLVGKGQQGAIAKVLGVSARSMSRYCSGEILPSTELIEALGKHRGLRTGTASG
jgi:hypothetical protein